ncbi:MFS general substrate transporter [Morchella snyderi]|nr:MFS general substrate transporter [Morchella snyderi]
MAINETTAPEDDKILNDTPDDTKPLPSPASPAAPEGREAILSPGSVDPVYEAKAQVLNNAMLEIGFGRYHKALFVVAGFGWMADNLWPQVTAIILPAVVNELHPKKVVYLSLAQTLGLTVGAAGWGIGSDIIGRRWAFNLTLMITGIFGLLAGAAPNFGALAAFDALWSLGVGGNLPVDSAVFLEFIPGTHQYLLTVMSVWWAFGQLLASAVAWPLMANFACESAEGCTRSANMGWRYFVFTMGAFTLVMFVIRFFVFKLHESPKFLMSRGKDAEAVKSIHAVARYNKVISTLTVEHLTRIDAEADRSANTKTPGYATIGAAVERNLKRFDLEHIRSLFVTPRLAFSTSLVIVLWGLIGLAYPLYNSFLPYFLASRGAQIDDGSPSTTFRNYLIIAVCGIPGSFIAGLAVELPLLGRKGAMSISTILSGIFLFATTTARTSNALLGWNCGYALTSGAMYGILYSYTPEIFPTRNRGTGNGLAATANRVCGIFAPVVAMYADLETPVPVYVSGVLFLVAGVLMLALPYETVGRVSI